MAGQGMTTGTQETAKVVLTEWHLSGNGRVGVAKGQLRRAL